MAKSTLNLTGLKIETAEVPATTRTRAVKDNPFTEALAASFESKTGRSVSVPSVNANDVSYLIRQAATDLGIGARIVVQDKDGNTLGKEALKAYKGTVRVLFEGKTRKARKSATPAPVATPAPTPAPPTK